MAKFYLVLAQVYTSAADNYTFFAYAPYTSPLRAWTTNDVLHVSVLQAGVTWQVK